MIVPKAGALGLGAFVVARRWSGSVVGLVAASMLAAVAVVLLPATQAHAAAGPPSIINLGNVPTRYWTALQHFESTAVGEVLAGHSLPASDAAAVSGWARNEVRAQMWADLAGLVHKSPATRTPDEQTVYDWFASLQQKRAIAAADAAIAEYKSYSGLGSDWLTAEPVPFSVSGHGYCNYHEPELYDKDYEGRSLAVCFTGSNDFTPFGTFLPPTPSFEQFVAFGAYDSAVAAASGSGYVAASMGTVSALGIGTTLLAAGKLSIPIARALSTAALNGSEIAAAILPWAVRAAYVADIAGTAARAAQIALEASVTGAEIFGLVAVVVTAVIDVVVTTVLVSLQIDANLNLPYKLQSLAEQARTTTPDLTSMFADEDAYPGLFDLFLNATLPEANPDCFDGGGVIGNQIPCANVTAPPAPAAADPHFEVLPAVAGGPVQSSPSIQTVSPFGETLSTRLSGHGWFVSQKLNPLTAQLGAVVPSLQLPYKDENGKSWNAEIVWDPGTDTYKFARASFGDTATADDCTGGVCLTDTIHVTRPDGTNAEVRIVATPPPPAVPNPKVSLAYPGTVYAGFPTSFHASSDEPNGAVTYTWTYICGPGGSQFCNILPPGEQTWTAVGADPEIILGSYGSHTLTVTATDALGGRTVTQFTVNVVQAQNTLFFKPPNDMLDVPPPGLAATQQLDVQSLVSDFHVAVAVAPASQNVCSVTGLVVTELAVGTCTLTATQTTVDLIWYPAAPVTVSFQVTRGHFTVEVIRDPAQYSDPLPSHDTVTPAGDFVDLQGTLTGCHPYSGITDAAGHVLAPSSTYPLYDCGGLTSWIYELSYSGFVEVRAEDASLTNTTQNATSAGVAAMTAQLSQADDGSPGDLSKAKVDFLLFRSTNSTDTPDYAVTGRSVNASGQAAATLTGLPADTYRMLIRTPASNEYFHAIPVVAQVQILPVDAAAPTITSASTVSVTIGTPVAFTVTTTGTPAPTLSQSGLPAWLTLQNNGDGTATLAGTPPPGSAGNTAATVTATNAAGSAAQQLTINIKRRQAVLQYSGDTNGSYSDPATLRATLLDLGSAVPGATITFTVTKGGTSRTAQAVTDTTGTATATMLLTQVPGAATVTASYRGSPSYASLTTTSSLSIGKESATIATARTNPKGIAVAAGRSGAGTFTLSATVRETPDASPGDITRITRVQFGLTAVGGGASPGCSATGAGLVLNRTTHVLTATCTVPAGTPVNVYDVTADIPATNAFYAGSSHDALNVYRPTAPGTSGGGSIAAAALPPNTTATFGFTVANTTQGATNGRFIYVLSTWSPAGILIKQDLLKSNLIGTLVTSTPNGPSSATFTGRATLNGVGGYSLGVTVHDSIGGDTYGAQTVTAPVGAPTAPLGIRLTSATTIGSGVIAIR